jgi:hypothetical protein
MAVFLSRFRVGKPDSLGFTRKTAALNLQLPLGHLPVPPADVVNRLPAIQTRSASESGIEHVTQDESRWPDLWEANLAVAKAYGLDAGDIIHVLQSFPVFARKRLEFMEFLRRKLSEFAI